MFVAGFIGSPQMNFIDATISAHGDRFHVDFGEYSVPIPEGKGRSGRIQPPASAKPVVLGLRAEDFHRKDILAHATDNPIEADVEIAELMGAEVFLYTVYQGQKGHSQGSGSRTGQGRRQVKPRHRPQPHAHLRQGDRKVICNLKPIKPRERFPCLFPGSPWTGGWGVSPRPLA